MDKLTLKTIKENQELKEMLVAWQDWWNNQGFNWYEVMCSDDYHCPVIFENTNGPIVKPPFYIAGNKLHNKWIRDGKIQRTTH